MNRWSCFAMLVVVLSLQAGCHLLGGAAAVSESDAVEMEATYGEIPGVSVGDLNLPNASQDKHGNLLKAVVRSAIATLIAEPRAGAEIVRPLRMGETLYVFDPAPSRDWLSVGTDPYGKGEGYCRADELFVTTHFEYLRLKSETRSVRAPVELFADMARLEQRLGSSTAEAVPADWVEQSFDLGTGELAPAPVLEVRDLEVNGGRVRVARVATWTWSSNDAEVVRRPSVELTQLRERLTHVDVLLIVDATGSMHHIWTGLRRYLNDVMRALAEETGLDVRVSIVAYRDYLGSGWLFRQQPLTGNLDEVQQWLDGIEADAGGDWEEALLDASAKGIADTDWRPGSYRIAVVAANNASHPSDAIQNPNRLTVDRIVQHAQQEQVVFVALQLPYQRGYDGDRRLLPEQLKALATGTGGEYLKVDDADSESPQRLIGYIRRVCSEKGQVARYQIEVFDGLVSGEDADSLRERLNLPRTVFKRLRNDVSRRLGVDPQKLAVAGRGEVGLEAGWVVFDPNAWEVVVRVREDDLDTLMQIVDRTITLGPEQPHRLAEMFRLSLNSVLGEDLAGLDQTLDVELKARGIPLRANSLLAFSLGELTAMPRKSRLQLADALEARYEALVETAASVRPDESGHVFIPLDRLP